MTYTVALILCPEGECPLSGTLDRGPMPFVGANPFAQANPRESSITHPTMSHTQHSTMNNFRQLVDISLSLSIGGIQSRRFSQGSRV